MTLLAFLVFTLADLATYRPWSEANPIVLMVGPSAAIPAKLWLLVAVPSVWYVLRVTRKYRAVGDFLVLFGALVGAIGFGSNYAGGL